MCAMDSVQDHAENQDKHLISHVASIVPVANNGGLSLDGERGRQLASVVVNNANSLWCLSFIPFNFPLTTFRIYYFYFLFCRISSICNSEPKCTCNCKCECKPETNGKFICLCLCNPGSADASNGFCICVCKNENKKCICICICKNRQNCGPGTHQCKECLVKIDIGYLLDNSFRIAKGLYGLESSILKLDKCCPCSCCLIITCNKSCCSSCQSIINSYQSNISKLESIELNFKNILQKFPQLRMFKIILSFYHTIATKCSKCPNNFEKISMLITNIGKAIYYYSLFAFRIYQLKYMFSLRISVKKNLENLVINYINNVSQNNYTNYYFISSFTYYSINEFKGSIFFYQELPFYYEIKETLSKGTTNCCCICCFKSKEQDKSTQTTIFENKTSMNPHYYEAKMSLYNQGNHLCLCLLVNYVLTNCIKLCVCYLRDIELEIIGMIYRFYHKYSNSTTNLISIGKMIMLIISIIYRITRWMKQRYLCTCTPTCTCLKTGECSSGCPVCLQPKVPCCTCKESTGCGNKNEGCTCKCKDKSGSCCNGCNSKCKSNQCCRCCCNCFCKSHSDPYYPYMVSIILYLSSLIENIWAMDNRAIVSAIQSLSNLYSEVESYDFNSINDKRKMSCNRICGLLVEKKCGKSANKCCWCLAIVNVLVACVSLCLQFRFYKVYKELCKNKNDVCNKLEEFCKIEEFKCTCPKGNVGCCLLKLASSSQLCTSKDLKELLKECCEECAKQDGCCKQILEKVSSGGDLLLIGCNSDCKGTADQVKAQCVLFENPCRPVAVVIVCKCKEPGKCCCIKDAIDKIKEKLQNLCEQCKCKELTKLDEICKTCCGGECPSCKTLKEPLKKICGNGSDCLCEKIKALKELCTGNTCLCKKEGCCRCVCCKLAIAGVKILTGACRQNFLEPYKRIAIELLSGSQTKEGIMRSIVNSINYVRQKQAFLVKNNYSTHFNTYSHHKNIANSFPSLTMGYEYDTVYEHQVAVNSCYMGINGIREDYIKSRSEMIPKRNKVKQKERTNVYTPGLCTH